jgi:hypothetical protein
MHEGRQRGVRHRGGQDSDVDILHIELLNKGIFEQQPFLEKQLYA